MKTGTLYWITGLSGSGKTTLAKLLYAHLKPDNAALVHLDGDVLREIYDLSGGHYDYDRRKQVAMRHARMCHLLTMQNVDVICSTISLFKDVRKWNRKHIENYKEIYLTIDDGVLNHRNHKQLVSDYQRRKIKHMVGKDVIAEYPENPDVILKSSDQLTPQYLLNDLLKKLKFT